MRKNIIQYFFHLIYLTSIELSCLTINLNQKISKFIIKKKTNLQ